MSAIVRQVALVSETRRVSVGNVLSVAAALQKQASRDLAPIWDITATVDGFADLDDVPVGYWPMIVMDDINQPGAAGVHLDNDGQPFALISAADQIDDWSLTASHEALEMLVDPFGSRLVAGDSRQPDQGRVSFLLEVCDPSEHASFGYTVNGVLVSDFYTPNFFDPVAVPSIRYSFTGAITEPRTVLQGGYLSWLDSISGDWWQQVWFGTNEPVFRNLGKLDGQGSLRSQIDRRTGQETAAAMKPGRQASSYAGLDAGIGLRTSNARALSLREQVRSLIAA